MGTSSARRPRPGDLTQHLKPEIGAPGASVSAVAGSGTGTAPSAARPAPPRWSPVRRRCSPGAFPDPAPARNQGRAHEHGRTEIMNRPALFGGDIAPITRIGGGEVRVDRAYASPIAAWADGEQSAALGFGFQDVTEVFEPVQDGPRPQLLEHVSHLRRLDELPVRRRRRQRRGDRPRTGQRHHRRERGRHVHRDRARSTRPGSVRGPSTAASNGANADLPVRARVRRLCLARRTGDHRATTPTRPTCRGRCSRRAAAYVTLGSGGGTSLGNTGRAADLELYSLDRQSALTIRRRPSRATTSRTPTSRRWASRRSGRRRERDR